MASRIGARNMLGRSLDRVASRRTFSASCRRSGPETRHGGSHTAESAAPAKQWSNRSVLAIAAAAAVTTLGASQISQRSGDKSANGVKQHLVSVDGVANVLEDSGSDADESGYATMKEMKEAIKLIVKELGDEDVISTDPEDLYAHGYSEWSTVNPDRLPVAVAYPRSTAQVSAIARICHAYRIPVIAYSGGTSLEGNFSAPYGGISIDFAFMDQIIKFNKDDMDVVVQPSVGWADLNQQLAAMDAGLFFPVDPGPTAKFGGMIGTNCSGTNAVKYGTMKDWVINLTVVLADGRVIKTKRRPRKSSAGYNLNSLFVGSEGTLGIVTEATLKLAIVPDEYAVAVVAFPSIRAASSAAAGVMQAGVPIAAMELLDEVQMRVINLSGSTKPRVWTEKPTLFFKFAGTKAGVKECIERVQSLSAEQGGSEFEFAKDAEEQRLLWSARKESLWSMLALRKEGEDVWSTDVAVPFSRLADIIEVSKKEMDDLGLFASILGHVGDGNFHESIMYNKQDPEERAKVEKCVKNMVRRALEMDGTCTGEHGIGWGKKQSLMEELGPETIEVMKTLKLALDPHWILNPGKIMDVPWLDEDEQVKNEHVGYVQPRSQAKIGASGGEVRGAALRAAVQESR